ncbi:MAG TPA: hypothetical protein DCL41_09905 [Bdellovibrionales bacterium]|nr:hypothetical protein [Pseudobdellovibrionaceae bacterium]HAG92177.1 hypothetical protein [Bdellovibrionales bacterium]|tara:strand:- start:749 stop:1060 length:312 start_codon:yes stop_codon:yes gene_type:complete
MTKNLFGLSQASLQKIGSVLKRHSQIERAIVYGSRAMGNFKPSSDIDLTLVGENLSTSDLLQIESELDDLLLPYSIDLSLFHQIENSDLKEHIQRVGKDFPTR